MKFEFDTVVDGAEEAAALVSALVILHGDGVLDAIEGAANKLETTNTTVVHNIHVPQETPAADGYPVTTEPSAADAFAPGPEVAVLPVSDHARDAAGIPWDERIHASTKTTNKDGTWTRRRNTPDATFDAVMTELKGGASGEPAGAATAAAGSTETPSSAAVAAVPPPPPAPPVTNASTAPASTQEAGGPATGNGPTVTNDASPSSAPPPPPRAGTTPTFPQIMVKVTKAQGAGKITKADVDGYLGQFGLSAMKDLAQADVDILTAFNATIDGHVGE